MMKEINMIEHSCVCCVYCFTYRTVLLGGCIIRIHCCGIGSCSGVIGRIPLKTITWWTIHFSFMNRGRIGVHLEMVEDIIVYIIYRSDELNEFKLQLLLLFSKVGYKLKCCSAPKL